MTRQRNDYIKIKIKTYFTIYSSNKDNYKHHKLWIARIGKIAVGSGMTKRDAIKNLKKAFKKFGVS